MIYYVKTINTTAVVRRVLLYQMCYFFLSQDGPILNIGTGNKSWWLDNGIGKVFHIPRQEEKSFLLSLKWSSRNLNLHLPVINQLHTYLFFFQKILFFSLGVFLSVSIRFSLEAFGINIVLGKYVKLI